MSRPGALRRRDRTLDAGRRPPGLGESRRRPPRTVPNRAAAAAEGWGWGMPRVGDSGSGGAGCGLRTGAGGAAEGGGSTAAGEQAGGWAARLGYGRERARFGLNVLYFAFFHIYVWYILCIEKIFSKIMGIQLNTIEFMWARPCLIALLST